LKALHSSILQISMMAITGYATLRSECHM